MANAEDYDRIAAAQRELMTRNEAALLKLVHSAVLAASSHNTQPWRFTVRSSAIIIDPDFSRRCPVVDPDDSHLFKSLGCATENISVAAPALGYRTGIEFALDSGRITIALEPVSSHAPLESLAPISARQCTRLPYDGQPLSVEETAILEEAGTNQFVSLRLVTNLREREQILEYVTAGNNAQLSDPAFRRELISWLRFNPADAIRLGDGLSGRASNRPALLAWLAKPMMSFVLTPKAQIEADVRNIRSSAGIAVFIGQADNRRCWIEAGRAYEAFALKATSLGIRNAFINQPAEVRDLRPQLSSFLGLQGSQVPLLMTRYGRGPLAPYSLRRALDAVISDMNTLLPM